MDDMLGLFGLVVALIATATLAVRHSELATVLLAAFTVRAGVALIHFYVTPLPDGSYDAVTFELYAWEWAQDGLISVFNHYPGFDSYFYSWLMSVLYAVTDRSLLLLQSTSVLVGVLGVVATWRLALELWDARAARKAAWVMALFPSVVQYGALPMREAWVVLFFILGLIGVVRWSRTGGVLPIFGAMLAFLVSSFFHGGMFVAILAFSGFITARSAKRWIVGLSHGRFSLFAGIVLIVVGGSLVFYVVSGVPIHKLGSAEQMLSGERWMYYFESRVHGGAEYPDWVQPSSPADFLWAVPVRGVYLLFSPFPWDLRSPAHLVGLLDGLLYFGLVFLIWRNRRTLMADPATRAVLFILLPLILAFGVGTGNFGTAMRHRAKLVVGLIVLAAPFIPRVVLSRSRRRFKAIT